MLFAILAREADGMPKPIETSGPGPWERAFVDVLLDLHDRLQALQTALPDALAAEIMPPNLFHTLVNHHAAEAIRAKLRRADRASSRHGAPRRAAAASDRRAEPVRDALSDAWSVLGAQTWWWSKTFDAFDPSLPGARDGVEVAQAYALNPRGWLVLQGGCGSGKTHLAAAIANVQRRKAHPVLYASAPDLFDQLRASVHAARTVSCDDLFAVLCRVDVLVLDDLDVLHTREWTLQMLEHLLQTRARGLLSTIVPLSEVLGIAVRRRQIHDPGELAATLRCYLQDPALVYWHPLRAPDYRAGRNG
jgi:DNA replication protein DnaC